MKIDWQTVAEIIIAGLALIVVQAIVGDWLKAHVGGLIAPKA